MTSIINDSLRSGVFPSIFKSVIGIKRMFLQEWCDNDRFVGRWKDARLMGVINDAAMVGSTASKQSRRSDVGMGSSSHDLGAHFVTTECK